MEFEQVYKKYYSIVYRYLLSLTKDDIISEESIMDQIILKEESSEIMQVVHQLEEPYKKVFSLRTFGEYSFKQIGDHFRKTESCSKELEMLTSFEDMGDNVDEEAAFRKFNNKMMKSNVKKVIVATVVAVAVIALLCVGMYEPTKAMKWETDLASVNAPEDGGLDIKINVGNYKNAYATYTMDENGKAIVYFTVEQNLLSACMSDEDSGDKIIRIANNICVSYHNANDELEFHLPENAEVTEVYYVQAKQDELHGFAEGNSTGAQAHLVWKK